MAAFLLKLEYYILFVKYHTLYYTSEAVCFIKQGLGAVEKHIEKLTGFINSKASGISDIIGNLSSWLNFELKVLIRPNQKVIIYAITGYISFYLFSYSIRYVYRSIKVKKLLKKDPYFAKLFEGKKLLNLKKITSKDFYAKLSEGFGRLFSKILIRILFLLWDNFHQLKIFKDKSFVPGLYKKVAAPIIKLLDILAILLEKSLIFVKIIEPASKDINVFLSDIKQKDIETLKKEIPEELHREFYLDETATNKTHFELISEYRKHITSAQQKWQNGNLSSMLIIGKAGCGKSSFINFLLKKYFKSKEIIRFEFSPEKHKEYDFDKLLLDIFDKNNTIEDTRASTHEKKIVVLDNLHFIFDKSKGNYDVITSFLNFIVKSPKSTLFIVSINQYAYDFLSTFLPIKNTFDFKLNLNLMKGFDIKKIFLAKAAKMGYTIYPRLNENQVKLIKRKINKGELSYPELTNYVLSEYFGKLVDNCENIFPALYYYFLSSISKVENKRIYVSEPTFPDFDFGKQFNQNHYLILVAIISHEKLNTEEISKMLDMNPHKVNIEISFLIKNTVLKAFDVQGSKYYSINPLVEVGIEDILKKKNFLYF